MSDLPKPTRADLRVVIARLQIMVTDARGAFDNDTAPGRGEAIRSWLNDAERLCHEALAHDGPVKMAGPWSGR